MKRSAGLPSFSHPILSLLLGGSWLLLNHSLAPPHLLAALLIAWGVPKLLAPLLPEPITRLDLAAAMGLTAVVLLDIITANLAVARLVLDWRRTPQPAWLLVPLASDHERLNALLASIITMTPGTVSVTVEGRWLLVHMLDCSDPLAAVAEINQRYQQPLLQIFRLVPEELCPCPPPSHPGCWG